MNTNILISIIIPCYNIAPYVEKCVSSVLQQTHQNIEVLLVDDGSTDETSIILDRLATEDERIKVIHKANGGVTSARLKGIEVARGEWIGFVDGDDMIEPDMYEHLLANAINYHADISHCGYQMVFPNRVDYYYNTSCLVEQDKQSGLKDLITGSRIEPCLCNKLFHKTLFHGLLYNNVLDLSIRYYEDLLMNFYLFREASSSVYEDICPYHYIVHDGSSTKSKLNEHELTDYLRAIKCIRQETTDNPELQRIANGRIAGILTGLATMSLGDQRDLIKPHRSSARRELRQMLPMLWTDGYSARTKLLATWAGVWPWSYAAAHKVYARIRGTDKKYEIS